MDCKVCGAHMRAVLHTDGTIKGWVCDSGPHRMLGRWN